MKHHDRVKVIGANHHLDISSDATKSTIETTANNANLEINANGSGAVVINSLESTNLPKSNTAAVDPQAGVDTDSLGYSENSLWTNTATDKNFVCVDASAGTWVETTGAGGGGGETNTASSVGTGAEVFKQKTGVDFEFRDISVGTGMAVNDTTDNVAITLDLPNINHNSLQNYSANEHLDWTADQGATNINDANVPHTSVVSGNPHNVQAINIGLGNVENFLHTTSGGLPDQDDDADNDYREGCVRGRPSDDTAYVCVDATIGAAIWKRIDNKKSNDNASVGPSAATDDVTLGYEVGSMWFNTTADTAWVCLDNTDGAAVWKEVTPASSGASIQTVASADNASPDDISAANLLVIKDSASEARLGVPASVNYANIVGLSAGAESGGSVDVHTEIGKPVASLSGVLTADKTYDIDKDGSLIESSLTRDSLANTDSKVIEAGFTNSANEFIWLPRVKSHRSQSTLFHAKFGDGYGVDDAASSELDVQFVRTSVGTYFQKGVLKYAQNAMPRYEIGPNGENEGLLIEPAATNDMQFNRDMTNYTFTNTLTVARDQTGIDLYPNVANKLTATGTEQTCIADNRPAYDGSYVVHSCFIKRITGSGTISLSADRGSTWTALTGVTNEWKRFHITESHLTGGGFGIKVHTSGDVIAVDYAQSEASDLAGSVPTSPMWSVSGAAARTRDILKYKVPLLPGNLSVYAELKTHGLYETQFDRIPYLSFDQFTSLPMFFDLLTDKFSSSNDNLYATCSAASHDHSVFEKYVATLNQEVATNNLGISRLGPSGETGTPVSIPSPHAGPTGWGNWTGDLGVGSFGGGTANALMNIKEIKILNHAVTSAQEFYLGGQ